jgi:hypothetical protein
VNIFETSGGKSGVDIALVRVADAWSAGAAVAFIRPGLVEMVLAHPSQ